MRVLTLSFLSAVLFSGLAFAEPCGNIDFTGVCEGNVLKYCNSGELVVKNCREEGKFCELTSEGYDCQFILKECGSYDFMGECVSGVATFCDEGNLIEIPCTEFGEECIMDSAWGAMCEESLVECGDVTRDGVCDGMIYSVCDPARGLLQTDCSSFSSYYNACDPAQGGCYHKEIPCGEVTEAGVCEGTTFKYCANGELKVIDCPSIGFNTCGESDEEGYMSCINTYISCGEVTSTPVCDGTTLKVCDAELGLVSRDCSTEGLVCQVVFGEGATCVPAGQGAMGGGSGQGEAGSAGGGEGGSAGEAGSAGGGEGGSAGEAGSAGEGGSDSEGGNGSSDNTNNNSDAGVDDSASNSSSDDGCSATPGQGVGFLGLLGFLPLLGLRRRRS